ncbi:MAG TPA: ABC transporter permease [Limnochordales bacterium]
MWSFLARRLAQAALTLWVFITVTFIILQLMPGDVTQMYLADPRIPPEVREAMGRQLGLDQPLGVQYLRYLGNVLTGHLGVSFSQYPTPVWSLIAERLPRTVTLFFTATVVSFYLGFVLGRHIAWRRGSWLDAMATGVGVTFWTAFYPLVALMLVWALAFRAGWLPLNQFVDPAVWRQAPVDANRVFRFLLINLAAAIVVLAAGLRLGVAKVEGPTARWATQVALWGSVLAASAAWWSQSGLAVYAWDIVRHMVLPVLALSLVSFGGAMLLMRDAMLETVREDYVVAARARGLPERIVRDRYAARNALLPVMTSLTLSIGGVASGGIVTETLFSWPGIGQLLLASAVAQDYPLAIGAFTFTGIFLIGAHAVADVLHAVLDPRLRIRGGEIAALE